MIRAIFFGVLRGLGVFLDWDRFSPFRFKLLYTAFFWPQGVALNNRPSVEWFCSRGFARSSKFQM